MRILFIFLACVMSCLVSSAQSLKGKVLYADTRKPVSSANVFLANTSVGTVTGEDGEFLIQQFPAGRFELVVSFVGYESFTMSVQSNLLPQNLEILLKPKVNELKEVILEPYLKDGWQKWGLFFIENFIGTFAGASECKLLNKEVLKFRFNRKENTLTVTADDRLEIENRFLGYHLKYDLVRFEYNMRTHLFVYQGYPLFQDIETKRNAQKRKWLANRDDTYYGSVMHFMRSLYRNKIIEQDFEVRKLIRISEAEKTRVSNIYKAKLNNQISINGNMIIGDVYAGLDPDTAVYYKKVMQQPQSMDVLINQVLPGDSIAYAIDSTVAGLNFSDYLQIIYKPKNMPQEYFNTMRQRYVKGPVTSEITRTVSDPIMVWANGNYYEGTTMLTSGYWAFSEKVGGLLPSDFWPAKKRSK